MGELKAALSCIHCAGERPTYMTKQFAFQKFFWDRSTIDWYKASISPWTQLMDRTCCQLFSSTTFTSDQDGRVAIRQSGNQRSYDTHSGAIPDQGIVERGI